MSGWLSSTNKTGLMALLTHKDQRAPIAQAIREEFNGKTLQGVIKEAPAIAALVSLAAYTPPRGVEPLGPDDEVPGPPVVQEAAPACAARRRPRDTRAPPEARRPARLW